MPLWYHSQSTLTFIICLTLPWGSRSGFVIILQMSKVIAMCDRHIACYIPPTSSSPSQDHISLPSPPILKVSLRYMISS
jgi:hypothetical protein